MKITKIYKKKDEIEATWENNVLTVHCIANSTMTIIEGEDTFKKAWETYKIVAQIS